MKLLKIIIGLILLVILQKFISSKIRKLILKIKHDILIYKNND